MCNLDKGFKLCTCAGETLKPEDVDWTLQRMDNSLPEVHVKGKAAIAQFTAKEEITKQNIVDFLNKENCFDFAYTPAQGDFLRIRLNKTTNTLASFRFLNGKWQIDKSTSLDAWRRQLVSLEKGKIADS